MCKLRLGENQFSYSILKSLRNRYIYVFIYLYSLGVQMQQNLQLVIEHQKKQLKLMLDQKMQKTKLKKISNSE